VVEGDQGIDEEPDRIGKAEVVDAVQVVDVELLGGLVAESADGAAAEGRLPPRRREARAAARAASRGAARSCAWSPG
jgi:hypothetical protein